MNRIASDVLPRDGREGSVPFVHLNGWVLFLSSRAGAQAGVARNTEVIDVTDGYYTGDYMPDAATAQRLNALAERIYECYNNRVRLVVHCAHGRTRSVVSVGVYLMRYHNLSLEDVMTMLRGAFSTATDPHYHSPGHNVESYLREYLALMGLELAPVEGFRRSRRLERQ